MKTSDYHLLSAAFVTIAACFAYAVAADSMARLKIDFGGVAGSECHGRESVQLAGSQAELVLEIIDHSRNYVYRGLQSSPPASLVLTAGIKTFEPGEKEISWILRPNSFSRSTALMQRLQPQFFNSRMQVFEDAMFHKGVDISDDYKRPVYKFLITLPEDLAGRMLCVHASLDDTQYGRLEGSTCQKIVSPCSPTDRGQMLGSYVYLAEESGNCQRAITLADSLIQTGWRWDLGIQSAMSAAQDLHLYDKALKYLDILYLTYGRVPPVELEQGNAETVAQNYQRLRNEIVAKRDQQQQR